jgi:hypothetical protein
VFLHTSRKRYMGRNGNRRKGNTKRGRQKAMKKTGREN